MSRRPSLHEQMLEKETAMLREQIDKIRKNPPSIPFGACDNSCCISRCDGQGTNGGCRCDEKKLRMAVMFWRAYAQHLTASLALLRDGDPIKSWDETYRDMYQRMLERESPR